MRVKSKFVFRKIKFPLRRKCFLPKHVQGLGISAWQAHGKVGNVLALLGWLAMGIALCHPPAVCPVTRLPPSGLNCTRSLASV